MKRRSAYFLTSFVVLLLSACSYVDCSKVREGPAILCLASHISQTISTVDLLMPDGDSVRMIYAGINGQPSQGDSEMKVWYFHLPMNHRELVLLMKFGDKKLNRYRLNYDFKLYKAECGITNYRIEKIVITALSEEHPVNMTLSGELRQTASVKSYNQFNEQYTKSIEIYVGK